MISVDLFYSQSKPDGFICMHTSWQAWKITKHLFIYFFGCSFARAVWFASCIHWASSRRLASLSSGHGLHSQIASINLFCSRDHHKLPLVRFSLICGALIWKFRDDRIYGVKLADAPNLQAANILTTIKFLPLLYIQALLRSYRQALSKTFACGCGTYIYHKTRQRNYHVLEIRRD